VFFFAASAAASAVVHTGGDRVTVDDGKFQGGLTRTKDPHPIFFSLFFFFLFARTTMMLGRCERFHRQARGGFA